MFQLEALNAVIGSAHFLFFFPFFFFFLVTCKIFPSDLSEVIAF